MRMLKVVETLYTKPLFVINNPDECFRFRIEILQDGVSLMHSALVFRIAHYDVAVHSEEGNVATEAMLSLEETLGIELIEQLDRETLITDVVRRIVLNFHE